MYSFKNDYSEGAHPGILDALVRANETQHEGYGEDAHSARAAELIRGRFGCAHADVHLISGGTQTNQIALSAFLRPHQAAVSAATGHILVHEAGAIEATGHKVISVDTLDGKLTPAQVEAVLDAHTDEHMVMPKVVYISDSTEIGTVYRLDELERLSAFCRARGLYLYMDGARLGSALTAASNDMTPQDIARLTDAFYIGGTKNGALFGEALVILNPALKTDMRFLIKQRGALLAKGFVTGIQFEALFEGELFFELARRANQAAALLAQGIEKLGYDFGSACDSNQLFPIFPKRVIDELLKSYAFYVFEQAREGCFRVRLVTSWATSRETVEGFIDALAKCTRA